MVKLPARRIHKTVAIGASLVLLGWIVSGIVMVVPYRWIARLAGVPPVGVASVALAGAAPADHRDFEVPIPAAIATLEARLGERIDIRAIRVAISLGRPVYEISLAGGSVHLIDGSTGVPIEVDRPLVERLAIGAVPEPGKIATVARIDEREFHYWGAVPAHKVVFEDPPGYVVYVSENAAITRTSRLSRLHHSIRSLHDLQPLMLLFDSSRLRMLALLFFSGLSLLVVLSGIYLALPARWRPRRPGKQRT